MKYIILLSLLFCPVVKAEVISNDVGTAVSFPSGISGETDGSTPAAGVIGETLTCTANDTGTVAGVTDERCSIVLTPGHWVLSGTHYHGASSTARRLVLSITTTSATEGSTLDGTAMHSDFATTNGSGSVHLGHVYANISTNTTYYLNFYTSSTSGMSSQESIMKAVRIR